MGDVYRIIPTREDLGQLSETEEANFYFVIDYLKVFMQKLVHEGDRVGVEEASKYYHEEVVFYDPFAQGPVRGIQDLISYVKELSCAFGEMCHTVLNMNIEDNTVGINWTATATVKAPMGGRSATEGEQIHVRGTSQMRLQDQRIIEIYQVWTNRESETPVNPGRWVNEEAIGRLTGRQQAVYRWILEGKSNDEISVILDISIRTVEKHCEAIYAKLEVENRKAAIIKGLYNPRE